MPHDQSGFSFKVWRIVDSKPFEIIIMVMIALNAIGLMLTVSFIDFLYSTGSLYSFG